MPGSCLLFPYDILDKGYDVIHIGFTKALSGTYDQMCMAAKELKEEYPDRKNAVDSVAHGEYSDIFRKQVFWVVAGGFRCNHYFHLLLLKRSFSKGILRRMPQSKDERRPSPDFDDNGISSKGIRHKSPKNVKIHC